MIERQQEGSRRSYAAIIIGGGFYGARLALLLRQRGASVLLLERDTHLLARASLRNQARVHNGYHYPRSILTALRSRVNYARFTSEYPEAITGDFTHYYAIARDSKVAAPQFAEFCRRIQAPIAPAPDPIRALFDPARIAGVFEVRECAFDAAQLRHRVERDLARAGVECVMRAEVHGCRLTNDGTLAVSWHAAAGDVREARAPLVFNCTYAALNSLLSASGGVQIPMKYELAELALVELPAALRGVGVTVMDGPYFSVMPYPSRPGLCTLSHVRYTPHRAWFEDADTPPRRTNDLHAARATRFPHMIRDAARYLPVIRDAQYVDSLWEIKALMPRSERDDSRPILLRQSKDLPGLISVLGAKIDSVYDVEETVEAMLDSPLATRSAPHA